jgi:hypothetical protein
MSTSIGGMTERGRPKYLEKNMFQCPFVHHKSYLDDAGINARKNG